MSWDKEWESVIFSDEKKFNLDGPDGLKCYWHDLRKGNLEFSQRVHGGGSVMIWAAFGHGGKTPVLFVSSRLNAKGYQHMLFSSLLPHLNDIAGNGAIFQPDNAAIHRAKSTMDWFRSHNDEMLDLPARSPDLNPIQNMGGGGCWFERCTETEGSLKILEI